ncbi:tumor suppressor protein, LOH1CR12 [Aspergillus terreus]|uniref:Tumor suppressor protein, LOH1CR12 n=1 Tax=Aspergillus terreus TaxID=33178 RepID=A0A5M3YVD1_ASPTE|nr:hypothetical protein ATETN484_0004027900 [Aspergillus terreus]GFF13169.1 tumor suppressor protein, LOH1CR12 [Aspergillus terreus]
MPSVELHSFNVALPEASRWRRSFGHRQFQLYPKVEHRLQVGPRESVVDVFLDCESLQLGPPQRYEALRAFLEKAKMMVSNSTQKVESPSEAIAIVDDRCDPTPIVSLSGNGAVSYVRAWTDEYINEPPSGTNIKVAAVTAEGLYRYLKKSKKDDYERRIIYATDLTPTMALAIIMNVAYTHLPEIRSYFDRHIGFHPYMKVSLSQGFVLEFHIPHFVLRIDQEARRDERGLRKCRYVQASNGSKHRRECIYEAQMSLIVFGVDEFSWTAYFFVDTYYSKQDSTSHYIRKKLDAPSGGYMEHNSPVWDPRHYFLTVLSIRLSQVTLEWSSLVQTIEANLDPHSDIDDLSLPNFVDDDPVMERTKQRTWTIGALRRLRNALGTLIAVWHGFEAEQKGYFDLGTEGPLFAKFRELFSHIGETVTELKMLHLTLEQRIETLEKTNQHVLSYWQVLLLGKPGKFNCI